VWSAEEGLEAPAWKAVRASEGESAVEGEAIMLSTQSTQEKVEWILGAEDVGGVSGDGMAVLRAARERVASRVVVFMVYGWGVAGTEACGW
jgi:hypothetical protein